MSRPLVHYAPTIGGRKWEYAVCEPYLENLDKQSRRNYLPPDHVNSREWGKSWGNAKSFGGHSENNCLKWCSDQAAQEATRYDDLGAWTLWSSSALSASEEVRLARSHLHPHYRRGQMIYYAHKNHIKLSMSPAPYSWFVHFWRGICRIMT